MVVATAVILYYNNKFLIFSLYTSFLFEKKKKPNELDLGSVVAIASALPYQILKHVFGIPVFQSSSIVIQLSWSVTLVVGHRSVWI